MRLVMVSINNKVYFINIRPDADGKFRIDEEDIKRLFGIKRGEGYHL